MRVETPPSGMPAPENLTEINFPRKELVHGLIETCRVWVLSGPVGSGKSNIARYLACSVALGQPFLGIRTHKSRVLLVNGELLSDDLDELDGKTAEGIELVVLDFPPTAINLGCGGSLSEFAERRKLAVFATSRRPGPSLLNDPKIVHWRLSCIDLEGGSYGHGRIETAAGRRPAPLPVVRGNDGEWTLDVYRMAKAFGDLGFHRNPQFPPLDPGPPLDFREASELERLLKM